MGERERERRERARVVRCVPNSDRGGYAVFGDESQWGARLGVAWTNGKPA